MRTSLAGCIARFFNGTSLCLRVHGQKQQPHTLDICPGSAQIGPWPPGWLRKRSIKRLWPVRRSPLRRTGGLPRGNGVSGRAVHRMRCAPPLRGGRGAHRLTASGCWPTRRKFAKPPFASGTARQGPVTSYLFMLNAVNDGFGGLEHRNSTAFDLWSPRPAPPGRGAPDRGLHHTVWPHQPRIFPHLERQTPGARRISHGYDYDLKTTRSCCGFRGLYQLLRRPAAAPCGPD